MVMGMNNTTERMLVNRSGREIPASSLRPLVVLTHDTALDLVGRAVRLAEHNAAEKKGLFDDVDAYVALAFEQYRARVGGRRGGTVIATLGDTEKVEVSVADYQRVTSALPAAQSIINDILDDLTEGVGGDLRALVGNAFRRDAAGRINVDRVLELRRLDLQHPRWPDAVRAINDAVETAGSRSYIRFYRRENSEARWEQINLNFSSL